MEKDIILDYFKTICRGMVVAVSFFHRSMAKYMGSSMERGILLMMTDVMIINKNVEQKTLVFTGNIVFSAC